MKHEHIDGIDSIQTNAMAMILLLLTRDNKITNSKPIVTTLYSLAFLLDGPDTFSKMVRKAFNAETVKEKMLAQAKSIAQEITLTEEELGFEAVSKDERSLGTRIAELVKEMKNTAELVKLAGETAVKRIEDVNTSTTELSKIAATISATVTKSSQLTQLSYA